MFKKLADIAKAVQQAKEMQGRMGEVQDRLAKMRIRGTSGGGVVAIEVNGKMDVLSCEIQQLAVESGDRKMLQELVVAAMNDALFRSKQAAAEAMQELTGGMPEMEEAMSQMGLK